MQAVHSWTISDRADGLLNFGQCVIMDTIYGQNEIKSRTVCNSGRHDLWTLSDRTVLNLGQYVILDMIHAWTRFLDTPRQNGLESRTECNPGHDFWTLSDTTRSNDTISGQNGIESRTRFLDPPRQNGLESRTKRTLPHEQATERR